MIGSNRIKWIEPLRTCLQLGACCTAVVAVAALQGCATMSEVDCLSADWALMGEVDGQRGRPLSELNRYRRQCAAYDVVPDTQAYTEARQRGLALYCTPSNGYREGRSGTRYELVCPVALEPDFQRTHQLGRAVFTSLNQLRNSGTSIQSSRREIADLRDDREDLEAALDDDDITDEERRKNQEEIDAINDRIDDLEDNIVIMTASLTAAIAAYTGAVQAARREGFDEPMESELIRELGRLTR